MIEIRYITRYCRLSGFCLYACYHAVLLLSSGLTHLYGLKCEKSNIYYITLPFRKPRRAFKLNYGDISCLPLVWLILLIYAQETFKYIITLASKWNRIAASHNEEFGKFSSQLLNYSFSVFQIAFDLVFQSSSLFNFKRHVWALSYQLWEGKM